MRYSIVLLLVAVLGVLSGCGPKVCNNDDSYWTKCVGEKKFSLGPIDGTYVGEWVNNMPHGQGTLTEGNKMRYVGGFNDGKAQGQGSIYRSDGTIIFKGEFKDNRPLNFGTFYHPDGSVDWDGKWCNHEGRPVFCD